MDGLADVFLGIGLARPKQLGHVMLPQLSFLLLVSSIGNKLGLFWLGLYEGSSSVSLPNKSSLLELGLMAASSLFLFGLKLTELGLATLEDGAGNIKNWS